MFKSSGVQGRGLGLRILADKGLRFRAFGFCVFLFGCSVLICSHGGDEAHVGSM